MKHRNILCILLVAALLLLGGCSSENQDEASSALTTKVAQDVYATITADAALQATSAPVPLPTHTTTPVVLPSNTPSPTQTPTSTPVPMLQGTIPEGWKEEVVPGTSLVYGLPPDAEVIESQPGLVSFASAALVDSVSNLGSSAAREPVPTNESGKIDAYLGMIWYSEVVPTRKLDFLRLIEGGKTACMSISNLLGAPSHLDEFTFDTPPMLVAVMANGRHPCLAGGIVTTDGTIVLSFLPPETTDIQRQLDLFEKMASSISYPSPALEVPK